MPGSGWLLIIIVWLVPVVAYIIYRIDDKRYERKGGTK